MVSSMAQKKGSSQAAPLGSGHCGERLFGSSRRSIVNWPRNHRDEGAPADPLLELHRALFEGEQRVVLPDPDPGARMKFGAALPHDDVARNDDLAAELLDPEPPPGAVAAVAGGAACLLMRHLEPPAPPPALAPPARPAPGRPAVHPRHGSRRSAARSGTGGGHSCGGNCAAAFS